MVEGWGVDMADFTITTDLDQIDLDLGRPRPLPEGGIRSVPDPQKLMMLKSGQIS